MLLGIILPVGNIDIQSACIELPVCLIKPAPQIIAQTSNIWVGRNIIRLQSRQICISCVEKHRASNHRSNKRNKQKPSSPLEKMYNIFSCS